MRKDYLRLGTLCLLLIVSCLLKAETVTALWDFQNVNPSTLSGMSIEGTTGTVASTVDGISLTVDATSGKFTQRPSDAQVNSGTKIQVPVQSTRDVVTVKIYSGYSNCFTIGGNAATSDEVSYTAKSADVNNGYVEIAATGNGYLISIQVVQQQGTVMEKKLYSTTFSDWEFYAGAAVKYETTVRWTTRYSKEPLDFTVYDTQISATNLNTEKFPTWTGGMLMAAKSNDPYIETSALASVTKVVFTHSATGNNRGWKLQAKGDGDTDWVTISDAAAKSNVPTEVTANVNRTNCQLRFTNLNFCSSSNDVNYTLTDTSGKTVATFSAKGSTDGELKAIHYTGGAGTLTLTVSGQAYLHSLTILNVVDGSVQTNAAGWYVVKAGDADNFLKILDVANATASSDNRTYIFLPDGTYDLGNTCLTTISGNNISIIGQSQDGTIIKNTPDNESINLSETLVNIGENTYMQDLTIQNALDYYSYNGVGRAVCLQDKGQHTICKNVSLLSYQDTYYSNQPGSDYYFETSNIQGTVDFICGQSDVFFNKCTLTVAKRKSDGKGECTITAPATDKSNGDSFGYVFGGCTIDNSAENFNFGRAWQNQPMCAYINTTIKNNKLIDTHYTLKGMNTVANKFVEYNLKDESGNVITPESKTVDFYYGDNKNSMNIVLSETEAAGYDIDKVFTSWSPDELAAQITMGDVTVSNTTLGWTAVDGALCYAVFKGNELLGFTTSTSYTIDNTTTATYSVRAANTMGGLGVASTTLTGDGTFENPYTVADVKVMKEAGMELSTAVWVKGNIVGSVAESGTELNTTDVDTNIAIADDASSTTDFIPVEVNDEGGFRDIVNVMDNSGNKGKSVIVYGILNDYLNVAGVTSTSKIYGLSSIKVGAKEGYGTYYTKCAYEMPEGLTGAVITEAVEAGTLEPSYRYSSVGDVVPAGTSLLVKGTQKTYNVVNTNSITPAPTDNLLHGEDAVDAETGLTSVSGTNVKYYILSHNKSGTNIGFYWGEENGAAMNYAKRIIAPHAFLAVECGSDAKAPTWFSLDGNGGTSGINATMSGNAVKDGKVYSVTGAYMGKSLNNLPKGVYIMNGKKIAVK